jgi:hypothetical protein
MLAYYLLSTKHGISTYNLRRPNDDRRAVFLKNREATPDNLHKVPTYKTLTVCRYTQRTWTTRAVQMRESEKPTFKRVRASSSPQSPRLRLAAHGCDMREGEQPTLVHDHLHISNTPNTANIPSSSGPERYQSTVSDFPVEAQATVGYINFQHDPSPRSARLNDPDLHKRTSGKHGRASRSKYASMLDEEVSRTRGD